MYGRLSSRCSCSRDTASIGEKSSPARLHSILVKYSENAQRRNAIFACTNKRHCAGCIVERRNKTNALDSVRPKASETVRTALVRLLPQVPALVMRAPCAKPHGLSAEVRGLLRRMHDKYPSTPQYRLRRSLSTPRSQTPSQSFHQCFSTYSKRTSPIHPQPWPLLVRRLSTHLHMCRLD